MGHRCGLRKGKHDNEYLQRAWIKYGERNFRFDVLETCDPSQCIAKEQYWMDALHAAVRASGYNICPAAGSAMTGRRHSKKSREKMSRLQKGRDMTAVTAAAAKAAKGKKRPVEVREKIAAGHKGKKKSAAHCEAIKATHWSKRPDAAEIAARIVANRPQTLSEEHKLKIAAGSQRSWNKRRGTA